MDWIKTTNKNFRYGFAICYFSIIALITNAQSNNGLFASGMPLGFEIGKKPKKENAENISAFPNYSLDESTDTYVKKTDDNLSFRSKASGNWNSISVWETSADNIIWKPAETIPADHNVRICAAHTITTQGNSVAASEIYIEEGAILSNESAVVLTGNLICEGEFHSSQIALLILTDIKNQIVSGTGIIKANDIEINKTLGSVYLKNNISVDGNFNLLWGIIYASNDARILFSENATTTNASEKSFISGPVQKRGNSAFNFPIGKSNQYKPIFINSNENVSNNVVTAEYFNNNKHVRKQNYSGQCEYWTMDLDSKTQKKITLAWDGNCCGILNLPAVTFARFNSSVWLDQGNVFKINSFEPGSMNSAISNTTIAAINITTPLRLTLLSFDAVYKGKNVKLSWIAASELDNPDFTIEQSIDGNDFETILDQTVSGKKEIACSYSSDEINSKMNISYFRLKQIFEGQDMYSDIVPIRIQRL